MNQERVKEYYFLSMPFFNIAYLILPIKFLVFLGNNIYGHKIDLFNG